MERTAELVNSSGPRTRRYTGPAHGPRAPSNPPRTGPDDAFLPHRNESPYSDLPRPRPPRRAWLPFDMRLRLWVAAIVGLMLAILTVQEFIGAENYEAGPVTTPRPLPERSYAPPSRLTAEERALIQVTDVELWDHEDWTYAVTTVAAPGLDREHVRGRVTFDAELVDGRTATFTRNATITRGEPVVVVGQLFEHELRDLRGVTASFAPTIMLTDESTFAARLTDVAIDETGPQPVMTATLVTEGAPLPRGLTVTTLVRDVTGAIRNLAVLDTRAPDPGDPTHLEIPLRAPRGIQASDTVEHRVSQR